MDRKISKQQPEQVNYFAPFLTMVFLFFIVGFLTTANTQFQGPLKAAFLEGVGDLKNTFATLITFSWFLAYPLCGGIGSRWTARYGYKGTLVRSLFVMIAGLALFFASSWFTVKFPAAALSVGSNTVPIGFFIFLLGSFVVGASATILQVVINPYLTACSVKGTQAIQRLAIGGSANSIGTTIAPFFVTGIVFGGLAMEDVQVSQLMIPFLALVAIMILVVLLLTRLSLPDIEGTKAEAGERLERSVWSFRHLTLGVVAIFFYVGVEVCIGANINLYAIEQEAARGPFSFFGNSSLTLFGINFAIPALMATLYWGGMLIGRLVGSSLRTVKPRTQLVVTTVSATVLTLLAIALNNPWLLAGVGLFHSIMWGAIFTLSVADLGKYTSVASGVFMIGVVGGAILPLVQGVLADFAGGWRWSWFLVIFGELFMLYYALVGSRIQNKA
jgi:FHS family L-fucose permease-like MFS transporter